MNRPNSEIRSNPSPGGLEDLARTLTEWFQAAARDLPWRRRRNPYSVWISEVMLQQTQVKTVIPYFQRWMRRFPNVKTLAQADLAAVLKSWEGLGYYTRARQLHRAASLIMAEGNGTLPATVEEWRALPGIGPYTAGAICSMAYDQPVPALDGNVIRVLARIFRISQNPRTARGRKLFWSRARALVETAAAFGLGGAGQLNEALMELGATVCSPRQPRCGACPVQRLCAARAARSEQRLPNLGPRRKTSPRFFKAFVFQRAGRVLVRRRPDHGLNGGLWEFPNREIASVHPDARIPIGQLEKLATIRHSITRYRITLEVFRVRTIRSLAKPQGTWRRISELDQLAFPSAHKKIVRLLQSE